MYVYDIVIVLVSLFQSHRCACIVTIFIVVNFKNHTTHKSDYKTAKKRKDSACMHKGTSCTPSTTVRSEYYQPNMYSNAFEKNPVLF